MDRKTALAAIDDAFLDSLKERFHNIGDDMISDKSLPTCRNRFRETIGPLLRFYHVAREEVAALFPEEE